MGLITTDRNQYGLDAGVVDAIHVRQADGRNEDNPWITALPPDTGYDMAAFSTPYAGKVSGPEAPVTVREKEVRDIMDERFPLVFQPDLLAMMRAILERSYAIRWKHALKDADGRIREVPIVGGDGELSALLCGITGCGKSTSIASILRQFPQVIRHKRENGDEDIQIPFLYAIMRNRNSDMTGFLEGLAEYADTVLHSNGRLRRSVSHGKLDDRVRAMESIIRQYHVGMLITDEVQNMDFFSRKKGSIQALVPLLGETKVGALFVGTPAAYEAIYSDPDGYIARRIGETIHASGYCSDKTKFRLLVKDLFRAQWFPTHVEPDDSIVDALYAVTGGTVGRLMTLYRRLNLDSLKNEKLKPFKPDWKPFELNARTIYSTDVSSMPGMADKLESLNLNNPLNTDDGNFETGEAPESHLVSSRAGTLSPLMKRRRDKVLEIVMTDFEGDKRFNPQTIEKHVDKVFRLSKVNLMTIEDLVERAEFYITGGKTDRRQYQSHNPLAAKATQSVTVVTA